MSPGRQLPLCGDHCIKSRAIQVGLTKQWGECRKVGSVHAGPNGSQAAQHFTHHQPSTEPIHSSDVGTTSDWFPDHPSSHSSKLRFSVYFAAPYCLTWPNCVVSLEFGDSVYVPLTWGMKAFWGYEPWLLDHPIPLPEDSLKLELHKHRADKWIMNEYSQCSYEGSTKSLAAHIKTGPLFFDSCHHLPSYHANSASP